jgi:hypothetical protein
LRGLVFNSTGGGLLVTILLVISGIIFALVICFLRTWHVIGELDQLWWSRLHGERIFFCIEVFEGHRVSNEDLRKLPRETSSGRNSLSLDALANLKLEAAGTILGPF